MKKKSLIYILLFFVCRLSASELSFEVLSLEDVQLVTEVVANSFTRKPGCPMTRYRLISKEDFIQFATEICREGAKSNLSMVAKQRATGKIVGALITLPHGVMPESQEFAEEKFLPILSLLDEIDKGFEPIHSAHHFFLAVDPDFQRRKVGKNLLLKSDERLSALGYLSVYAEAATPISQRIFSQFGYQIVKEIMYETYASGPYYPFQGIERFCGDSLGLSGPLSCKLVLKQLASTP